MSTQPEWMHRADPAILQHLHRERLDYATLIARDLEMPPGDAKSRCETLAERDLIEPVSREVVYRITARGERWLADARGDAEADAERERLLATDR